MPDTALNPMLSAERINELIEQQVKRFAELLRIGVRNIWQSGYLVGQVPPSGELEELLDLQQNQQQAIAVAGNQQAPEGDRVRAQRALMRQVELERKFFGGQPA